MKQESAIACVPLLFALFFLVTQIFAHAEISRAEWEAQNTRAQLIDQEKSLLQENDELRKDVDELKAQVNVRLRKISAAQDRLDKIRHDLITIKMKLLP